MALTYCKKLHFVVNKRNTVNALAALFQRTGFQNILSAAHYSDETKKNSKVTLSRAMKAYLERVATYDEFMKEQLNEYNRGKEFLASMMGRKSKEMTQKEVDEAIDYLFPSALFVPKARPLMKPPEEIYEKQKKASFDYTGRPFHFLFYTSKPNFSECLHEAALKLEELNKQLYEKRAQPKPLSWIGGRWMNQTELQELVLETLHKVEYDKFIEVIKKLSEHPLASEAEKFLKKFWIQENVNYNLEITKPSVSEDGVKFILIKGSRKKTAIADVKLSHPGTGKIRINNLGIDYFFDIQSRHQPFYGFMNKCELTRRDLLTLRGREKMTSIEDGFGFDLRFLSDFLLLESREIPEALSEFYC